MFSKFRSKRAQRKWASDRRIGNQSNVVTESFDVFCLTGVKEKKMSSGREGYLRDLPHPNLNEVLKSNTQSAIKLLKTGKLV